MKVPYPWATSTTGALISPLSMSAPSSAACAPTERGVPTAGLAPRPGRSYVHARAPDAIAVGTDDRPHALVPSSASPLTNSTVFGPLPAQLTLTVVPPMSTACAVNTGGATVAGTTAVELVAVVPPALAAPGA